MAYALCLTRDLLNGSLWNHQISYAYKRRSAQIEQFPASLLTHEPYQVIHSSAEKKDIQE